MLLYPLFAVTVVLLTWLNWDFLHDLGWTVRRSGGLNYPSGLARGELGFLQSLNFAVVGVLALVFLLGLRRHFRHRISGTVATVALGLFAVGGLLNAAPTDLPGEEGSLSGTLHGLGFFATLLGALIGIVAAGLALRGAPEWRGYVAYSIATTPLAIATLFVLAPLDDYAFYVMITLLFGWFGVMGFRLRQLPERSA